jgi:ABC-type antimicrobial peptide transport system permease subunit
VNVPGHRSSPTLDDTIGRNIVGPRFVETMGLTLIAGRDFDLRDGNAGPAAVIVNQSFAQHFFGTDDVLGRQIFFIDSAKRPDTIIGVVRDARDRGLKESTKSVAYSNYEHDPLGWITFTVRVHQTPETGLNEIVSEVKRMDPHVPIAATSTVEAKMDESLQRERMLATLSGMLGILTVLVAVIGLYGLLAYSVARRTHEIGVRIALGASLASVEWLAVREGLALVLGGVAIGFPSYLVFARIFRAQVYGVTPGDTLAFASVLGLLLLFAGSAIYIPALRSARINPVTALKYE